MFHSQGMRHLLHALLPRSARGALRGLEVYRALFADPARGSEIVMINHPASD
jgi:hypothetical protein